MNTDRGGFFNGAAHDCRGSFVNGAVYDGRGACDDRDDYFGVRTENRVVWKRKGCLVCV